ncbi:energy transducer TonB [Proteus sp. NMG38-2]|uniref:energy transducer TonB family protein n=1 Tax=Proteus sp. NMG38-2 TaxID=2883107 RepID=UPI001D0A495D|nr:energy transducer TonB [Proteus sp. NMG38-2]UDN36808.1 energy transducer TonB [Proteus sp. NMG38-2]
MNKTIKPILIIVGIATLLFPFWLPALLVSIISTIDSVSIKILPSSVRFDERNFLLGLWLGSAIMTIVMLLQSWRAKNIFYFFGGVFVVLTTFSLSFSIIPHSELEDRRRFVLQNIEQSQWSDFRYSVINAEDNIIKTIVVNQPKTLGYLKDLEKKRIELPGLVYLTDDVTSAMQAKEAYLIHTKGTPEQKEAIKTLSFYGDWLLNQPEIIIAQALSSLLTSSNERLVQSGINAITTAPLVPEAWQTLALTYIAHTPPNMQIEKAMAALMVSDTLKYDKLGHQDPSLQPLIEKAISELTENQRQIYQILQARVIEDRLYRQKNAVPEAVAKLAGKVLPVTYAIANNNETYVEWKSMMNDREYPGIVLVDSPNKIQNWTEMHYPSVGQYIPIAETILSVDVDPQGHVLSLWVQKSSGYNVFDTKALSDARGWRFMPTKEGYHQRVTVRFQSTRLGWNDYTIKQQPTLIALAKAYARQSIKGISNAENAFIGLQKQAPEKESSKSSSHSTYDPYSSVYSKRAQQQEERAVLQNILKEIQTLPNGKNNHESWDNSLRFLNEKLALHQDNEDVVRMVARFELQYYNVGTNNLSQSPDIYPQNKEYWQTLLSQARSHFGQAIALNPNREDVWLGWGITWLDEDPEIAAGAFAKAAQQKSQESISSVMQMLEMRMVINTLEGARLERYQTLRARMDMRYLPEGVEAKPSDDYLSDDLTQIQLAQRAIPASDPNSKVVHLPLNTDKTEQSNRTFSVDFASANIKDSTQLLPKVNAPITAPKTGDMILQLDVDPQGVPTVVMLKTSSGDMNIDNAVIDVAYQWRFNGSPSRKGNVLLISVQFGQ